jgi:ketosteroid isomerase-like protein
MNGLDGVIRTAYTGSVVPAQTPEEVVQMPDDETRAAVLRFDDAINRHDIDALDGCITDDCLFEDTTPPDATRHEGRSAVLTACRRFFTESPSARFEIEDLTTAGDRAVVRWRYQWDGGHVRGVDLVLVKAGRVAQTIAYVKG